jgi:hypothetical protein
MDINTEEEILDIKKRNYSLLTKVTYTARDEKSRMSEWAGQIAWIGKRRNTHE